MTFDDDYVCLHLPGGTENIFFGSGGVRLSWPPPERLFVDCELPVEYLRAATPDDDPVLVMRCTNRSQITDDQRGGMTHVCRGAEYFYEYELADQERDQG